MNLMLSVRVLTAAFAGITIIADMGRIRQAIKIDGQRCWTLFDIGARNTYVIPSVARVLKTSTMLHAFRTALGGEVRETKTSAILEAEIEGHPIAMHALVIEAIGKDKDGKANRDTLWRPGHAAVGHSH
jgi:hypothetical protein